MAPYKVNKHSIEILAPKEEIFKEIVSWGESRWWPVLSNMKFIKEGKNPPEEGTRYLMKVVPFGPSWRAQVTKIEKDYSIRRDFLDGMFSGFETVSILNGQGASFKIVYEMYYQVNGKVNQMLWPTILEKIHNLNIEAILGNLKRFVEKNK